MSHYDEDEKADYNCSIIPVRVGNSTQTFEFGQDWEGIPFNFIINSVFFVVFICLFAALRRKAWDKRQLTRTNIGWLHFIYGDRKSIPRVHQDVRYNEHHSHGSHPNFLLPPVSSRPESLRKRSQNGSRTHNVNQSGGAGDVEETPTSRYQPLPHVGEAGQSHHPARSFMRSLSIDSASVMGRRLLDVISIKDSDIQKAKGVDAVQYLMFQRYIIFFLSILTIVSIVIVLPINMQGNLRNESPYGRTTVSNIPAESSFLWAHAILSLALVPFGVCLMWHFARTIKEEKEQVARRTLFIRRIPKAKAKKEVLINYFTSKFPEIVIDGVQLVYDIKKLRALYNEHANVVNAIGYCHEYLEEYSEPCEIRPYFLGHFGGLCCCCMCCRKSDGLTYYQEVERDIERDLEKEFRETISNPMGSVFITFRTEQMAQTIFRYLRHRQDDKCALFSCCLYSCTICRNLDCREDELSTRRWVTCYAPDPEDVNWDDISVELGMLWLRRILVNLFLFIVFFFMTTPIILINILNYAKLLLPIAAGLKQLSPILTEYLSPLLLVLAALILPVIVQFVSSYLPYKTVSEQNHSIMWKVFLFLILMVLILPSLDLTSAMALIEIVGSEKFRWQCLFPVGNGAFFINYVLQSALLGNAFELLRLPELIIYFYYTLIWTKSAAEYENARQQIMFDFAFGVRYPRFLLIFVMVVTYSLSCPLIAPCGLLYMGLKHLVDKYNIYYVYVPSKINDQIHSTAIMFFHIGLLMMQFQVFTFSFIRTGYSDVTGLSMVSVIISLIFFAGHFFFNCFQTMSNNTGVRKPDAAHKSEFCACLYLPPVLFELNENGIRSEALNSYGSMHSSDNDHRLVLTSTPIDSDA